jgi:hypothetical protein
MSLTMVISIVLIFPVQLDGEMLMIMLHIFPFFDGDRRVSAADNTEHQQKFRIGAIITLIEDNNPEDGRIWM